MSMIGNLRRASDLEIRRLLADPDSIEVLLGDGADDPASASWSLDVDKAWHGIHFLLTGTAWEGPEPLDFLVRGGEEVGDIDVGYGPARAFCSREVIEIWGAVEPLGAELLAKAYDPKAMTDQSVYPSIWDRDPKDDDALGYVLEYYALLREFLAATVAGGQGVLIWIS